MNDEDLMREALALARQGRASVEPNPRVGALALRDGAVVGRGFHSRYGGDHAEVVAFAAAAAHGAAPDTLVVTLEPCCSEPGGGGKKTPPCTDAILRAGVKRVVIGALDPDPRHHDLGVARLREQGVDVVVGVLAAECAESNRPFTRWLQMDVPWMIAKWAMSLDGKTATHSGDSKWISSEASRTRVHQVRGAVDAVMVGLRTAVVDDPELTVRHVAGVHPTRVVIDPLAELPPAAKLVATAAQTPTWVVVSSVADPDRVAVLRQAGVTVVEVAGEAPGHGIDLAAACLELRTRGLRRILMEGGGGLAAGLFDAGLVHQVMVFLAPMIIGGAAAKTPVTGVGVEAVRDAWKLGEVFHEAIGDDIVIHGFAI